MPIKAPLRFHILVFTALVLTLGSLHRRSIYILDEAKNATCAREMYQANTLIVPTFNGELRTDKPPLHYYAMMLSYAVFGATPFAARLGSGIMGLLTVLLLYQWVARRGNVQWAWWSALVLLSSLHFGAQMQLATPDPYLIFLYFATLALLYDAVQYSLRYRAYAAYACMGLACMAKGPVAAVLPGLTFLMWMLLSRGWSWEFIRALRLPEGAIIVAAIAVPWYVAVHHATHGAFTEGFFIKHNLSRYSEPMEGHGGFVGLVPLLLLVALLPVAGFVVQAFAKWWRDRKRDPLLALSGCAALSVLVFFSFSGTILPSYVSPALPFATVVVGRYLSISIRAGVLSGWPFLVPALMGVALLAGGWIALSKDPNLHDMPWLVGVLLPLVAGAAAAYSCVRLKHRLAPAVRSRRALYWALGGAYATTLLFQWVAYPMADARNPVALAKALTEESTLVAYKRFNPAFVWAQGSAIPVVHTPSELSSFLNTHPKALVISTTKHMDDVPEELGLHVVFSCKDLFERPITVICRKAEQEPMP